MKLEMKNSSKWILMAIVPILASCANQQNQMNTDVAQPVSVMDVTKGTIIQFINTTGTASAAGQVILYSEMAGNYYLQKNPKTGNPFKLGDLVESGQVIVRIENAETANSIAIATKKLNLEIDSLEYQKQKSLYDKGGVTLRELKTAEIALAQGKTDYENAKIQLAKMEVKSPFRGVIVDLPTVTNSTRINSNVAVITVMDYSKLLMEVNLPEKSLSTIKIGQEVFITNYTLPKDTLKAQINELSPVVNIETRTFKGKVLINNPDYKLRPGMFVKADIEVDRRDSAIVIPKEIIVSGARGKTVFVIERGTSQARIIRIGLENEKSVEVLEGLRRNDRVVTKGYETLRNNSRVKIIS
jgi:membrane fusion protein (multidrug efflux system)